MTETSYITQPNRPAGLVELPLDKGACLTRQQLVAANADAIKQNFSRALNLPEDLEDLKWPITNAWRHTAFIDGKQNVRLGFFFVPTMEAFDKSKLHFLTLDISDDRYEALFGKKVQA